LVASGACSSSSSNPGKAPSGSDSGATVTAEGGAGDAGLGDENTATPGTEFDAALAGGQVVPAVSTTAKGTAKFVLAADGQTLTYDITQNVAGATSVNLHIGAIGENGAVSHQLTPVSGHMTGSVSLTPAEQSAVAVDQLYVDVPSGAHPGGEIRGQAVPPGAQIYVAVGSGTQEVPGVQTAYNAHAAFVLSPDQGNLLYHVVTDAVPTDVRLHRAIASMNGPVAFPLTPIGQTLDGTIQIGASDPGDLQNGRFYLNIVTAANPAGELRGQVLAPGEVLFAGPLAGANEVPPVMSTATGGSQFILSADQTKLHYEAVVSGVIPTAAEIDSAPLGQNGPTLYTLTLDQQGALGQASVAAGDVPKLFGGLAYVNVRTESYVNGELRAQLVQP
jgi:hypothetical protein